MATPDGAVQDDGDLDSAISSLDSEGVINSQAPMGDLNSDDPSPSSASQPTVPASAPTKDAAPAAPGDQGTAPSTTPDPLEGTEPFKYTVGQESKVLEGFYRVPGEGVMVPEDKVPILEQLAVRAETLDRMSRESQQQTELFERLSEWTTQGQDGKDQTLSGIQGLIQSRLDAASDRAYVQVAQAFFSDPTKLASLLTYNPETGKFEHNLEAMENAKIALDNARMRADTQVRGFLSQRYQPPPEQRAPDYTQVAPQIIAGYAGADASVLTKADQDYLAEQMVPHVRKATAADVRENPRLQLGQDVVDQKFRNTVMREVMHRKDAIAKATAATEAGKFNAGQDKGRQPGKTPKVASPQKPASASGTPSNQSSKPDWDTPLQEFLQEQGISS